MGGKGSAPSKPSGFPKWEPLPSLTLSGGCLSLHWQAWRDRGTVSVGGGGPTGGVSHTLLPASSSVFGTHPHAFRMPLLPSKGAALGVVTLPLIVTGVVELASLPSPGFSSRRFLVWKTSGSWLPGHRPVPAHSLGGHFHCRLVPIQSVLMSVRLGDWMASVVLREAYPPVPVHPESRRFLCFVAHGRTYRFNELCFGLVHGPTGLPSGLWLLYPFFIPWVSVCIVTVATGSSSHRPSRPSSGISGLSLSLCRELGIVVNPE